MIALSPGAIVPSINTVHTQIVPAFNQPGLNCAAGITLPTLPDFSTLDFRSYNFEKLMLAAEIETLQQFSTAYGYMYPMAIFVGGAIADFLPPIPGLGPYNFLDLMNIVPSLISAITGSIPGTGIASNLVSIPLNAGTTIVNNIIDSFIASPPQLSTLVAYGLTPLELNLNLPPQYKALLSFQQIMKNWLTFDFTTALIGLIGEVLDIIGGSFSLPSLPTKASLFALLESNMDALTSFTTLWGLKSEIEKVFGRSILEKKDLFVSMAAVKSSVDAAMISIQKELERRTGKVVTIAGLVADGDVPAIISDLFPNYPVIAVLDQIRTEVENFSFIASVSGIFNINIPIFGNLLSFPEPFLSIGTNLAEYNFDPAGLANVTDRLLKFQEFEFNKAWDTLTGSFANYNFTQVLGLVTDTLAPEFGFSLPLVEINISC